MSHAETLHRPAPRQSYRRFLIAFAALAMVLPLRPAVTEAQTCFLFANCTCTPITDTTFYPQGPQGPREALHRTCAKG